MEKMHPDDLKHSLYDSKHSVCNSKHSFWQPGDLKHFILRLLRRRSKNIGEHEPRSAPNGRTPSEMIASVLDVKFNIFQLTQFNFKEYLVYCIANNGARIICFTRLWPKTVFRPTTKLGERRRLDLHLGFSAINSYCWWLVGGGKKILFCGSRGRG